MWGRAIKLVVILCLFLWSLEDGVACAILLCGRAAVLAIRPAWINFLGNRIEIMGGGREARWKKRKLISGLGQRG